MDFFVENFGKCLLQVMKRTMKKVHLFEGFFREKNPYGGRLHDYIGF